ncbi:MAG: BamA/TamA family outer membrane protein [Melioribacteraceae bacterium]|nr:BamA/TamA family outer membrane protein [Melioribacteraceae bacterium]
MTKAVSLLFLLLLFQNYIYTQNSCSKSNEEWEVFPILNYDTDVGFGYGGKGFLYNFLNTKESFDITAYNSTKGERWYRLVFSIPDMQRRQGKKYDLALDLIIDYDKWINHKYYFNSDDPCLNDSLAKFQGTNENYIKEPIEIITNLSSAIRKDFIIDLGIKFKSISCYNFEFDGQLQYCRPTEVRHLSLIFSLRFDTRSDFLSPNKGIMIKIDNEIARDILKGEENFFKVGFTLQSYLNLGYLNMVLATRLILQKMSDSPYQNLFSMGGNNSIRGLPQDRYLTSSLMLLNEELRFPIFWKLGGIVGADIGYGEQTEGGIINPVVGLRLYMNNFIVRADLGFGKKSIGFYFNFGHLF